jgi:hypothetical protein
MDDAEIAERYRIPWSNTDGRRLRNLLQIPMAPHWQSVEGRRLFRKTTPQTARNGGSPNAIFYVIRGTSTCTPTVFDDRVLPPELYTTSSSHQIL